MGVALPTGYIRTTNEPLDALYLDAGSTLWASVAAATNQTTGLSNFVRYIGQFVNIDDGNGKSELYWFKDGITDPDLVPFASGGGNYTGASPTTVVVENYPIGTPITGVSFNDLFENIYAPVIPPSIPTFSPTTSSFSNLYECGDKLTAIPTADFIFTVTNLANIVPNSLAILDITQGVYLTQNQPVISPINNVLLNSFPFGLNIFGTNQWGAEVTDSSSTVPISSPPYTVTWAHKMWYGTSPNNILNSTQIQALQGSSINSTETIPGSYFVPANANEYKYFCWEDTIPFDPVAIFGFMFGSQQLPMADSTIDPAYSNVTTNGWSYALASYQNGPAVSNYRIFRTATPFGGAMNITIQ